MFQKVSYRQCPQPVKIRVLLPDQASLLFSRAAFDVASTRQHGFQLAAVIRAYLGRFRLPAHDSSNSCENDTGILPPHLLHRLERHRAYQCPNLCSMMQFRWNRRAP